MIIIGIAGGIGYGKTTLAEALISIEPRSLHLETSTVIAEVINNWQSRAKSTPDPNDVAAINEWLSLLPDVLEQVVHIKPEQPLIELNKNGSVMHAESNEKLFVFLRQSQKDQTLGQTQITADNKSEYRALLQWLGGYVQLKLPRGIWFHELIRRAASAAEHGKKLCVVSGVRFPADVEVIHDAGGFVILVERPSVAAIDTTDPTERERSRLQIDTRLVNDAGIDELKQCAQRIYADIKRHKLRKFYEAANNGTKSATIYGN